MELYRPYLSLRGVETIYAPTSPSSSLLFNFSSTLLSLLATMMPFLSPFGEAWRPRPLADQKIF